MLVKLTPAFAKVPEMKWIALAMSADTFTTITTDDTTRICWMTSVRDETSESAQIAFASLATELLSS